MAIRFPYLEDRFGRRHTNLRVSVTDRCNIRCFYCMPENVVFKPREQILRFDEITRFVRAVSEAGISKVRITGGEPLVRKEVDLLIRDLASIGLEDLSMTTNGILLAEYAERLYQAGLQRLNISLDGLSEETFVKVTRRSGLQRVIEGIDAACRLPFRQIRLNAIAIRDLTEDEILPLAQFANDRRLELRFIEFMPLDADGQWRDEQVLSGATILARLQNAFSAPTPLHRHDPAQPATDYEFPNGLRIGLIQSVTQPFCSSCNRLRITAEGKLRNCLFSTTEWDVRSLLRECASTDAIIDVVRSCVQAKKRGHGSESEAFVRPERAMYQIGG